MSLRPLLGLLVKPFHVGLELGAVHPPDTAASDLDGGELTGSDQGVDLGDAHRQVCGHVFKSEESGLDLGFTVAGAGVGLGHLATIAPDQLEYLHLASFAAVCCEWAAPTGDRRCR
jgi:hypothetical protein